MVGRKISVVVKMYLDSYWRQDQATKIYILRALEMNLRD